MRAYFLLAAVALTGCYRYHVEGEGKPRHGLSESFHTVAIEVAVAPGVEANADDIAAFATEVEERVRATKVYPDVRHGPTPPGALAVRVRLTKLEHKESWSIQHGTSEWYEAIVDVELFDTARASTVDRFSIKAVPGALFELPGETKLSLAGRSLTNAARGIAGQLKKRR